MLGNYTWEEWKRLANIWDKHRNFLLADAAIIWHDEFPPSGGNPIILHMQRSLGSGELDHATETFLLQEIHVGTIRCSANHENHQWGTCQIPKEDLLRLCQTHNHFPATLFEDRREEKKTALEKRFMELSAPSNSAAYLDKNGPHFSPELEAAVSAWIALFQEGGYKNNRASKGQITAWVKKNRPQVSWSKAALDRIAGVCNPEKLSKGGAPKTE